MFRFVGTRPEEPAWLTTATGAVARRAAPPVVLARCRRSGAKTLVTLVLEGRAVPVLKAASATSKQGSQVTLARQSGNGSGWGRSARIQQDGDNAPFNKEQVLPTPDAQWLFAVVANSGNRLAPRKKKSKAHHADSASAGKPWLTAAVILCSGTEGQGRR